MALSQCAALMEDVPHRRARSGLGPLGRKRLQGGTKAPTSRGAQTLLALCSITSGASAPRIAMKKRTEDD